MAQPRLSLDILENACGNVNVALAKSGEAIQVRKLASGYGVYRVGGNIAGGTTLFTGTIKECACFINGMYNCARMIYG